MNNPTVRTVKLYGPLGGRFGREFKLAVSTPAEAVQALSMQLPGFEKYLTEAGDKGMAFTVFVGKRNVKQHQLADLAEPGDIRIAPVIGGRKNGGLFQVILGIILIVVGVIACAYGYAPLGQALIGAGLSMVIGGIIQMLMPKPKKPGNDERPEDEPSYAFNGPVNTQAQGHPVPLCYGRLMVGSAVISAGIALDDTSTGNTAARPGPGPWTGGSINNFVRWAYLTGASGGA